VSLSEWNLRREAVDIDDYCQGRMGPYRVGPRTRRTRHGEIYLAITDEDARVVELELLAPDQVDGQEPGVLKSIDRVLGLEHRHLASVLGAGQHEGVIYLARLHRLGRSLGDVLKETPGHPDLAPGLLYALSEVVGFLAESGPHPGSCSVGGFDAADVELGFEGEIRLRTGTQALRDGEQPGLADRLSLAQLSAAVAEWSGWPAPGPGPEVDLGDWARRLRRQHREACAGRRTLLGGHLRRHYAEAMRSERARFGLSTIQ
jgi:hypothetical protein